MAAGVPLPLTDTDWLVWQVAAQLRGWAGALEACVHEQRADRSQRYVGLGRQLATTAWVLRLAVEPAEDHPLVREAA